MSFEWRHVRLGSLVEIKHGFAFKGEFFSDEPTAFQLTTPGNFAIGGGFQAGKGKFYSGSVPNDFVLKTGNLLVTMTDLSKAADTLGYAAELPETPGTTWLHNQRVGLVTIKQGVVASMSFLHYLMRSPDYRHWVVSTATGSTVKEGLRNALRGVLMSRSRAASQIHPALPRDSARCGPVSRPVGRLQAHSCLRSHQSSPRHPQVGQRKQRV
jgi:hypothetical protein